MRVLYFGIYDPERGRNRIYMNGLRDNGVARSGMSRRLPGHPQVPFRLMRLHLRVSADYDCLIVGYPGHVTTPLARLLTRRPVILDALCSLEEGVLISRGKTGVFGLRGRYVRWIDQMAVRAADVVLVESEAQRQWFERRFGRSPKYKVLYTGADDRVFFRDAAVRKKDRFTAVFRGKFLPEAGARHIVASARRLQEANIDVLLVGNGFLEREIRRAIADSRLNNITLIDTYVPDAELRQIMLSCHVSLGQFEDHERLLRTIPHKCFETLALGLPYVTARTGPVAELLEDGTSVVLVNPADPDDLAEKVIFLSDHPTVANSIAEAGHRVFHRIRLTPRRLGREMLAMVPEARG